ncbi:MAG: enoyl-CoA hydratase/isomerase family protein [Acetobacteraceae bacterium]|nr:enoyl-CoA hydratase/isomerase family protein [Acetobacteraceae bacterium]
MLDLRVADNIATITMANAPVNAMSNAWMATFHTHLDVLDRRNDWAVLHIRSALKIFCAGAELKEMRARFNTAGGIKAQINVIRDYQLLYDRIESLPRVTLAEINGAALGGGFELALACDLRVAAQEAKIGLPELRLGLLPGAGGTQRMTHLAGRPTALRLILGAEQIDGTEAERLGLVQWCFPLTNLQDKTAEIARRYAALPPHAATAAKACITAATTAGEDGFAEEISQTHSLLNTEATRSLVVAFLDRTNR